MKNKQSLTPSPLFLLGSLILWLLTAVPAYAQIAPIGDVANGTVIYQQRCANCHGLTGLGDGELAAQAVNPPTPLGDPDYNKSAIPNVLFGVITNGRLNNGMPLFGEGSSNPLSEQERWDVIAYLYALGTSRSAVLAGSTAVTEAQQAIIDTADWANSNNSMLALPDDVAAFGRMAQFNYLLGAGQIAGTVVNGSTGAAVPDATVRLRAFEGFELVDEKVQTSDSNGAFQFELTDVTADLIYQTQTEQQTLTYNSDFIRFDGRQMSQPGSLTVFDVSATADVVTLVQQRTVVDVSPDSFIIDQLYTFRNDSQTAYTGGLNLFVPEGATDVSINNIRGGQMIPNLDAIKNEAGWQDTQPLRPGGNGRDVVVRYQLPLTEPLMITHDMAWPTDDSMVIVPEGVTVGTGWTEAGQRDINGRIVVNYVGTADTQFSLTLSGQPALAIDPATGQQLLVRNETQELLIGGGGLLLALLLCGGLLYRWQKQAPADKRPLLQAIAELDAAYAAGQIKRQPYQDRRQALMQQLRDIW